MFVSSEHCTAPAQSHALLQRCDACYTLCKGMGHASTVKSGPQRALPAALPDQAPLQSRCLSQERMMIQKGIAVSFACFCKDAKVMRCIRPS